LFDRPKPTAGCSANGRRRRRFINLVYHMKVFINSIFLITQIYYYIINLFVKCDDIQGVSGGIVHKLGGGSMDYSE
jgi:hypothetical protein